MTRKLTDAEEERCKLGMLPVSTEAITGRPGSYASSTSLHEISHAVVAIRLGMKFGHVMIVPTVDEDGVAQGQVGNCTFVTTDNPNEACVHVLLAPAVLSRLVPFDLREGWEDDYNKIRLIGHHVFGIPDTEAGDVPSAAMLSWIVEMGQRTQAIVEPLLKGIALLAEQLDVRKLMSYEDVCEICAGDIK